MPTVHIAAQKSDVAKIVLMPGDPLRAKWIAENYLKDAKLITNVRNMSGYTGYYNNKKVTIMAHGMGIPSIGIYSYELYKEYDVDLIIRIGSAGSYKENINLGDLFIVDSACSNSSYAKEIGVEVKNNTLYPSKDIYQLAIDIAKEKNIPFHAGNIVSHDAFYNIYTLEQIKEKFNDPKMVEMESFGLFANAIKLNKKAMCLLTCSDSLVSKKYMSSDDREKSFKNMAQLALDIVDRLS